MSSWRPGWWIKYWGREKAVNERKDELLYRWDDAALMSIILGARDAHAYETGADAMLEALRKTGSHLEYPLISGVWVFIPDDGSNPPDPTMQKEAK